MKQGRRRTEVLMLREDPAFFNKIMPDHILQQSQHHGYVGEGSRNRPHEGGLRARRPVVGPVLTAQHCRARLAFATEHQNWQIRHRHLVLFTDESRFYLSTCDRRDRLWRRRGECYAACITIQHDWFGGGSVMVWGGISLEGRTDLYRLDNGTLTAIRYQDEILRPIVRPYAGAVGIGFLLVHNNARPHVARVCRQFLENEGIDTIDWPPGSPELNPVEHFWDIMFRSIRRHQVAYQTVQELSDALVQIWEEIPQDTIRQEHRDQNSSTPKPSVVTWGAEEDTRIQLPCRAEWTYEAAKFGRACPSRQGRSKPDARNDVPNCHHIRVSSAALSSSQAD
ncbi:hypothetical protein NFI96_003188 [Prochilodus magdalenae]|nr:hypothetical protein NFI96_003188 [Prochilodus magdalenae]